MLESRYFQLASIFRVLAVKDFTFGLTKRRYEELQSPIDEPARPDDCYLVIHFRGDWTQLERVLAAAVKWRSSLSTLVLLPLWSVPAPGSPKRRQSHA